MSGPRVGPRVVTFGCRLNTFESEVMRRHAEEAGLDDAIIVNTCAVTAEAERQVRQAIRRLRRENPEARIVVAGCAAQLDPDRFAAMPEVDRVLGNREKLEPGSFQVELPARVLVNDVDQLREVAPHLVDGFAETAKAFVQVQQGCDHRCTFCIIPFARGPSRSAPTAQVVEQVRRLVAGGHQEVVLTGVDLTSYGHDLPEQPPLGALVRLILRLVPELPRLRLSSVDPSELDDDLVIAFGGDERLMPQLHLSVQAGDDLVLARMLRRHRRADVIRACARMRAARPDLIFGADFITGFPTETDEAFDNTLRLLDDADLTLLHVFPYSERPGTPATRMPSVPKRVRSERAARLRARGDERLAGWMRARIGERASVLAEADGRGRSEHGVPVRLAAAAGELVAARVIGVDGHTLVGERIGQAKTGSGTVIASRCFRLF